LCERRRIYEENDLPASVFISHADKDASLANKLTDLLLVGLGLKAADIFCTSLAGLGIPAGQDFKGYIRKELADSTVVIALLSPNYYASAFCLCEAGATWVLAKDFIPFVVEPSTFSEMKAVLQGTQALQLNEETALDEMRERIESALGASTKHAWWTKKKQEFLVALPDIIANLPKPGLPTAKQYAEALQKQSDYEQVVDDLEQQVRNCQEKYTLLSTLKDREEVKAMEVEYAGERAKFDALESAAAKALAKLSSCVVYALYKNERGEAWVPSREFDDQVNEDVERGLLKQDEGEVTVNVRHPQVVPAIKPIEKLRRFVEKEAGSDFADAYEVEHSDEFKFSSKGFWERHLVCVAFDRLT
jgi:hypothetical protein